jgi:aspartate oxidase
MPNTNKTGAAKTWDDELKEKCDAAMPGAIAERRRAERLNAQAPAMYALLKDLGITFDDEADITNSGGPNLAMRLRSEFGATGEAILAAIEGGES